MTRNLQKIMALTRAIRAQGATDDLLKETVVTLADEVVRLHHELETVRSTATRAERQSRMPVYGARR
jgi:hypothetical protein